MMKKMLCALLMLCLLLGMLTSASAGNMTFTTTNLLGETVDESIFAGKDLTLINVWATWCNPCVREMPELAAWAQEMPENMQLLYMCYDSNDPNDPDTRAKAEAIAGKAGLDKSKVIFFPEVPIPEINSVLMAYPTTFFVNGEGHVLPGIVVGADMEAYREYAEMVLGSK